MRDLYEEAERQTVSEIETAEEFGAKFVARVWDAMGSDLAPNEVYAMASTLIEVRDNAVANAARLAVLDEFVELTFKRFAYPHSIGTELAGQVRDILRAKYSHPKEPTSG